MHTGVPRLLGRLGVEKERSLPEAVGFYIHGSLH